LIDDAHIIAERSVDAEDKRVRDGRRDARWVSFIFRDSTEPNRLGRLGRLGRLSHHVLGAVV